MHSNSIPPLLLSPLQLTDWLTQFWSQLSFPTHPLTLTAWLLDAVLTATNIHCFSGSNFMEKGCVYLGWKALHPIPILHQNAFGSCQECDIPTRLIQKSFPRWHTPHALFGAEVRKCSDPAQRARLHPPAEMERMGDSHIFHFCNSLSEESVWGDMRRLRNQSLVVSSHNNATKYELHVRVASTWNMNWGRCKNDANLYKHISSQNFRSF